MSAKQTLRFAPGFLEYLLRTLSPFVDEIPDDVVVEHGYWDMETDELVLTCRSEQWPYRYEATQISVAKRFFTP